MKLRLWRVLFVFQALAAAQQTPSVDELLPRLYAYAREYRAKLPSFSCDESITSQAVRNGKVKKEVKIEGMLREIRDEGKKDPFRENHTFKSVNGQPAKAQFHIPFLVQGGFANMVGFVREETAGCFDYHLVSQDEGKNLRLDLALKPNHTGQNCTDIQEGFRKTVVLDAATGRIIHVERTISAEVAKQGKEVYFASVDYAPQKLGSETFWLPVRLFTHDADDERRMYVTYSNFHRYTGEMSIVQDGHPPE